MKLDMRVCLLVINLGFITFNESFDVNRIVGKNIKLGDEISYIENYEKPRLSLSFRTYKVCWLLHDQDQDKLVSFMNSLLHIDDDEEVQIKTGNVIITISFLENVNVKRISGIHQFNDKKIKIVTFGDAKKCFGCKMEGHLISNCPFAQNSCQNCGKKGHVSCTYADRIIGNLQNNDLPHNDEDEVFNNLENNNNSNNNENNRINNELINDNHY